MIDTNYCIEALSILLDRTCLAERYSPLIACRDALLAHLVRMGCRTKRDAERLTDAELMQLDGMDAGMVRLLRRFFTIYDPNPQKFREIGKAAGTPEEQRAFWELYHLPGVRAVRADLYCRAGYVSLQAIAEAAAEEILARTAQVIAEQGLSCIVPLPKEVRTHIAVARAFTWKPKDEKENGAAEQPFHGGST